MDKDLLKRVIQDAWCEGSPIGTGKDTFGDFLDRAADKILALPEFKKDKEFQCGMCGGLMSKNPHPEAGKPESVIEVGAIYECISVYP